MTTIQNVSIPKPCHQQWQQMTPNDHGRHCGNCAKTVVDFTRMTDAEVISYLTRSANTCGRFNEVQLNSINAHLSNQNLEARKGWKKWMMATLLFGSTVFYKAHGQSPAILPITEQGPTNRYPGSFPLGKIAVSVVQRQVTGQVLDDNNEPLPGALVKVQGTNITAISTVTGKFHVGAPLSAKQLVVSFIGFENKVINIDSAPDTVYIAKLNMNPVILGEPAIVQRPSLVKRIYYSYIRKPFRRIFK